MRQFSVASREEDAGQEQDGGDCARIVDGPCGQIALDAALPDAGDVGVSLVCNVFAGPVHAEVGGMEGGDQGDERIHLDRDGIGVLQEDACAPLGQEVAARPIPRARGQGAFGGVAAHWLPWPQGDEGA